MSDASTAPEAVTAAIVSDYLRAHPDFFDQHPDVLGDLKLAHVSDGAVSLVERQVALLRERNAELRRRLDGLVARAEQNEALLHATQEVISSLAERSSKDDIASLFCSLVKKSFSVELVAFHWCGDNGDSPRTLLRRIYWATKTPQVVLCALTNSKRCLTKRPQKARPHLRGLQRDDKSLQ